MRALITGSAGFVGRHFMRTLFARGWDVDGIDVKHHHMMAQSLLDDGRSFNEMQMSVGQFIHGASSLARYDLVVHAAAAGPNRAAIDSSPMNIAYNTALDAQMLEWAVRTGQRHFVYLSSSAVYSDDVSHPTLGGKMMDFAGVPFGFTENMGRLLEPFDAYGATKRHGEQMALAAAKYIGITIVRPFSGYGEDQSTDFPFGAFVDRAFKRENPFVIWGNSAQRRDFIHIEDIVRATLILVEQADPSPVNICTGRAVSMGELAAMIVTEFRKYDDEYDPGYEVRLDEPMGVVNRVGDPVLLHRLYTPKITIEQGVRRAVEAKIAKETHRG